MFYTTPTPLIFRGCTAPLDAVDQAHQEGALSRHDALTGRECVLALTVKGGLSQNPLDLLNLLDQVRGMDPSKGVQQQDSALPNLHWGNKHDLSGRQQAC